MIDYYNVLGLKRDCNREDIKRAYRKLAKIYHPDVNKSPESTQRFRLIKEAYDYLIDVKKGKRPEPYIPRSAQPSPINPNVKIPFVYKIRMFPSLFRISWDYFEVSNIFIITTILLYVILLILFFTVDAIRTTLFAIIGAPTQFIISSLFSNSRLGYTVAIVITLVFMCLIELVALKAVFSTLDSIIN